jgi:D-glycero-D-manno-heptose 1,7-bisphosphate phosphatase
LILQEFNPISIQKSTSSWLIVFDRDNTLNQDFGYTHKVEDFSWRSGITDLLAALSPLQANFAIASNQGGIAKGVYTVEAAKAFNANLVSSASEFGVYFTAVVFCPHGAESGIVCSCRKPAPGMLIFLINYFSTNLDKVIFIGDSIVDKMAAQSAGVVFLNVGDENLFQDIFNRICS